LLKLRLSQSIEESYRNAHLHLFLNGLQFTELSFARIGNWHAKGWRFNLSRR
jgi:hypothetical protein